MAKFGSIFWQFPIKVCKHADS
uniref:Uncharacterized protein n=1 Tax=Rhizophora mucronata TaxID=61149 RepID=A0A2P2Q048_RHIMU